MAWLPSAHCADLRAELRRIAHKLRQNCAPRTIDGASEIMYPIAEPTVSVTSAAWFLHVPVCSVVPERYG